MGKLSASQIQQHFDADYTKHDVEIDEDLRNQIEYMERENDKRDDWMFDDSHGWDLERGDI